MNETPILHIRDLRIAFQHKESYQYVVDHLELRLWAGKCLAVVGESGSGKTMTALSIVQLLPVSALVDEKSQIIWQGKEDLLNYSEKKMRTIRGHHIGVVFQDAMSAFNPVLTIQQQMYEILRHQRLSRGGIRQKALKLLHEVGIADPLRCLRSYPHELSGGMRQRAMIAMALCGDPEILIADEPTTAVDVTIQAQILNLLVQLKQTRKLALLFISHDLAVVSKVADEVLVMHRGKVVEQSLAAQFFKQPRHAYSQSLLAAIPPLISKRTAPGSFAELLTVKELRVYFSRQKWFFRDRHITKAVDNISFKLPKGKTLALVGESGSGKTTTAKAIMRLVEATSGEVVFDHHTVLPAARQSLKYLRKNGQFVFQDPYAALDPRMMIRDSLLEGQHLSVTTSSIDLLLEQVGLKSEHQWRYPHEFSGGERQRLCIARALAPKPKLLILDEPTSALDVSIQMQILQLLERLQEEQQLSYLLITHNLSVVAYLADWVAIMREGHIVEQGPTEKILANPEHPYTQQLLAAVPEIERV